MPELFNLQTSFTPSNDQRLAMDSLGNGLAADKRDQVLLGVTGSGKTFTVAHVIAESRKPALILAHNKILAAQLYEEMKGLFPNNAVCYFVSYYDYYQPEAYVPQSDTYIEKESSINEHIDRLRHEATRSCFERRDTIIVASVSCIYGIGDKEQYTAMTVGLAVGEKTTPHEVAAKLVELQYRRNDIDFRRGYFRLRGDSLELFPSHYDDKAWRFSFFGDELEAINEFDPLTGKLTAELNRVRVFANSHYVTTKPAMERALKAIKLELKGTLARLRAENRLVEAQRLEERTNYDLEMMVTTGSCPGIENYSRHLSGRASGSPPPTLFEYLPEDALLVVDESHVTVPQLGGMFKGDRSRKQTLVEYGFRLPSCVDNRPLSFEEWDELRPHSIFISATPGPWELKQTAGVITEQLTRPTGVPDPICIIRPATTQVDDLLAECRKTIADGFRILVTTLTKKMAEQLSDYLAENGLKVRYMHSDIETLERIELVRALRSGEFDVLVGINLLREGLDIPECALVAILDADKEGFLRSKTSIVQTIGRAARNLNGRVILYADKRTESINYAMAETERRRAKQIAYNKEHNITPRSVKREITSQILLSVGRGNGTKPGARGKKGGDYGAGGDLAGIDLNDQKQLENLRKSLENKMQAAARALEFEEAIKIRDKILQLERRELGLK